MPENDGFSNLTPDKIIHTVEDHAGLFLESVISPFNSYVNRVFGLQDEEHNRFVVKFYRPGRWSRAAIGEEHEFIKACSSADVPVAVPVELTNGSTIGDLDGVLFALYPRKGGRTFDITCEDDWVRLGSITGRMHRAAQKLVIKNRVKLTIETAESYVNTLLAAGVIHPDVEAEFENVCRGCIKYVSPLFEGPGLRPVHGDCHKGNILDRGEEGLLLIDFDDMCLAPRVQDLWLLLPGHRDECHAELELLLEGYETFMPFDRNEFALIEPLRFIRIIYFLQWCAMQKDDPLFPRNFPDWGTKSFWIKEIEDIRFQLDMIHAHNGD